MIRAQRQSEHRAERQPRRRQHGPSAGTPYSIPPRLASGNHDQRLNQLRRAAEALASGDAQVAVPTGYDDIGRAGRSLARLADDLGHRLERMVGVVKLSEGVNAVTTLEDALDFLYYSFRALIPYDRIGCALLVDDGRTLRSVWGRSRRPEPSLRVGYQVEVRDSSLERILATGKPRIINDLEAYFAEHPDSDATRLVLAEGMRSSLTCSLGALGRRIGCLFFSSFGKDTYRDEHVAFYRQIARVIGAVVERTVLYEEVSHARDELEAANTRLQTLADVDGLTLIANRRTFDRRVESAWRRALITRSSLSLLMIDVDDFKAFNDFYGHVAGDECLRQIAAAISGSLRRSGDFVARYGGEEFAAVLPNTERGELGTVAQRCLESVRSLVIPHGLSRAAPFVTLSIGGATWDGRSTIELMELLELADKALYRAKHSGKNRVSLGRGPEVAVPLRRIGIA